MRRGRLAITIIVVICAITAEALYALSHRGPVLKVATTPITRGAVVSSVTANGTLQALNNINVGTQVTGRIKELDADFNSIVHAGQMLARLDDSLFQEAVTSARATVTKAKTDVVGYQLTSDDAHRQLERAEQLRAHDEISPSDLEDAVVTAEEADSQVKAAQAGVVQAQAALDRAELDLKNTVILSPVNGTVLSRNVDLGQTVVSSAQAPTLFVIAPDLTKLQVYTSVDESDIGRLHEGMPASFRVEAFTDRTFDGTITEIRLQPVQDQNVVTYTTIINVANPQFALRPGMTATVTIETARRDDVLRVPTVALRFTPPAEAFAALRQPVPPEASDLAASMAARTIMAPGRTGKVWVLANGRLHVVPIKLGLIDGPNAEVASGDVSAGTQIATDFAAAAPVVARGASPLAPTQTGRPMR
jgi:HlyD family secretion protein